MMRLFEYEARMPAADPLTRCTSCRRSWCSLLTPDEVTDPGVLLMVPTLDGDALCARCMHSRMGRLLELDHGPGHWITPWHLVLWGYYWSEVA